MLPDNPKDFDPRSKEDIMFESLKKLPDDYYVFHSFRITQITNNVIRENEIDFLIFNKNKGILCIEAKAGCVRYENGSWVYSNGTPMKYNSPYTKASLDKHNLLNRINNYKKSKIDFIGKCKFLHAVWFPDYDFQKFLKACLPSEADTKLTLTNEALQDPKTAIDKIFNLNIDNSSNLQTTLTESESQQLIEQHLCPLFNLAPLDASSLKIVERKMARLLEEQISLLNFLEEQKSVAINGGAGTGKTFVAIEKARRLSLAGEKILFLCYNVKLKEYLEKTYSYENVDYYNIDAFTMKLCGSLDYKNLNMILENKFYNQSFEYTYVICDEGQDFGRTGEDGIEQSGILTTLKFIVEENGGAFYIFYDKFQLIQGDELPRVIQDCDCKITLYKNCRNTKSIGKTFISLLKKETDNRINNYKTKLNFWDNAIDGTAPNITINNNKTNEEKEKLLQKTIDKYINDGFKPINIVILTCKTIEKSFLSDNIHNDYYNYSGRFFLFTTCRKYKGLEAEVVILIDIDKSIILETTRESKNIFYVGASRARYYLELIANLNEEDCKDIILQKNENIIKKPEKTIANMLSCLIN